MYWRSLNDMANIFVLKKIINIETLLPQKGELVKTLNDSSTVLIRDAVEQLNRKQEIAESLERT